MTPTDRLTACQAQALQASRLLDEVHDLLDWDPHAARVATDRTLGGLLAQVAHAVDGILDTTVATTVAPKSPRYRSASARARAGTLRCRRSRRSPLPHARG